jgi:hypothetical protein
LGGSPIGFAGADAADPTGDKKKNNNNNNKNKTKNLKVGQDLLIMGLGEDPVEAGPRAD